MFVFIVCVEEIRVVSLIRSRSSKGNGLVELETEGIILCHCRGCPHVSGNLSKLCSRQIVSESTGSKNYPYRSQSLLIVRA